MFKFVKYNRVETTDDVHFEFKCKMHTISSGFQFDGMSNLYGIGAILGFHRFGISLKESLIHDYLYVNKGKILAEDGLLTRYKRREADDYYIDSIREQYHSWQISFIRFYLYNFGWLKRRF